MPNRVKSIQRNLLALLEIFGPIRENDLYRLEFLIEIKTTFFFLSLYASMEIRSLV